MLRHIIKVMMPVLIVSSAFVSCHKDSALPGSNIPNHDHMQFTLRDTTHNLTEMRCFTDSFANSPLKVTTIEAFNMADNVDVGEIMMINIYHSKPLKAGDIFMAGTPNANDGALYNYSSPNYAFGGYTSLQGQPGSVTLTDVTPNYIKGTFSIQLFLFTDFNSNTVTHPACIITKGSFYATLEK